MSLTLILALLPIPVMAITNHIRGGGRLFAKLWGGQGIYLPGRGQWWLWPIVALCAWTAMPWYWALLVAATWVLWSIPAWGRWFTIGHIDRTVSSGSPSWWETLLEKTGWDDFTLFTIRNTVCILPLMVIHPLFLNLGFLQATAYAISWAALNDFAAIAWAELLTGALWGAAFFIFYLTH